MTKHELIRIDVAEWRALRSCTQAPMAGALWIEMLWIMQEAEPYGHLLVHRRPVTDEQLAAAASVPAWQMPYLLERLEAAGVISRTAERVIYATRLIREERKREVARRNGRRGGNPSLRKTS